MGRRSEGWCLLRLGNMDPSPGTLDTWRGRGTITAWVVAKVKPSSLNHAQRKRGEGRRDSPIEILRWSCASEAGSRTLRVVQSARLLGLCVSTPRKVRCSACYKTLHVRKISNRPNHCAASFASIDDVSVLQSQSAWTIGGLSRPHIQVHDASIECSFRAF